MEQNMKYPFYLQLWFWWISLTIFYILGSFSLENQQININTSFLNFIGLFVPIGIWNFIFGGYLIIPLIAVVVYGEKYLKKIPNPIVKIISNLFVLLVLTFVVDMIIWGEWRSLMLFLKKSFDVF